MKKNKSKRTTLKDVALKVGLTPMAVSLAINNDKSIPIKTKERILQAVKELNYYPNLAARALIKGKTNNIAVVSHSFYSVFDLAIMKAIEDKIGFSPYGVNYFSTKGLADMENEIFRKIFYGRMADGIISFGMVPKPDMLKACRAAGFPIIVVEGPVENTHINVVTVDNLNGGALAAAHFIKKGKKNIVCVTGAPHHSRSLKNRKEGFEKELANAGIKLEEKNIFELPFLNFETGKTVYREKISQLKNVDAVFCAAGDMVAIGIIHEAKKAGVDVPGNLSVIGYDNLEAASFMTPTLTTIKQPLVEIGEKVAELMMKIIKNGKKDISEKVVFKPQLVEGESA